MSSGRICFQTDTTAYSDGFPHTDPEQHPNPNIYTDAAANSYCNTHHAYLDSLSNEDILLGLLTHRESVRSIRAARDGSPFFKQMAI